MKLDTLLPEVLRQAERLLAPAATSRNLPARRYVSHGEPAVEFCDGLLAVWAGPVETKQVGPTKASVTHRVATVCVDVWRCFPTGDTQPPTTDQLQAVSLTLADDVDRLTRGLAEWLSCQCQTVAWRPTVTLGPTGGMAGWRVVVQVGLE